MPEAGHADGDERRGGLLAVVGGHGARVAPVDDRAGGLAGVEGHRTGAGAQRALDAERAVTSRGSRPWWPGPAEQASSPTLVSLTVRKRLPAAPSRRPLTTYRLSALHMSAADAGGSHGDGGARQGESGRHGGQGERTAVAAGGAWLHGWCLRSAGPGSGPIQCDVGSDASVVAARTNEGDWTGDQPSLRHRLRRLGHQGRARGPGGRRLRGRPRQDQDPQALDPRGGGRGVRRAAGPLPRLDGFGRGHRAGGRPARRGQLGGQHRPGRGSARTPTRCSPRRRVATSTWSTTPTRRAWPRSGTARRRAATDWSSSPRSAPGSGRPSSSTACWCRTPSSATSRSTGTTPRTAPPARSRRTRASPTPSGPSG